MSTSSEKKTSFGRYLLQCRRKRGISAESLAAELKISVRLLSAIENEDFNSLPDAVYTRGFLSAYAGIAGADREWVIQNYQKTLSAVNSMRQHEEESRREGERFWHRLGAAILVLLGVMAVTVLVSDIWRDRLFFSTGGKHRTAAVDVDPLTDQEGAGQSASARSPEIISKSEDDIRLSIRTIEETWIKIIIDNKTTREYTLQPGDRLELEASNSYNLLIGNAAGIRLTANRIPIDVPGGRGEVVNIEIP